MTTIQTRSVDKLLAKLAAAAEAVEFPAVGVLTVELFWSIAEERPELSNLLLLAEREADRIRKACDDYARSHLQIRSTKCCRELPIRIWLNHHANNLFLR